MSPVSCDIPVVGVTGFEPAMSSHMAKMVSIAAAADHYDVSQQVTVGLQAESGLNLWLLRCGIE
jgi:hypothetical protein